MGIQAQDILVNDCSTLSFYQEIRRFLRSGCIIHQARLGGLETIPWLLPDDKIYFSDHAYHDYRHTAELTDVLLPFIQERSSQERAWEGIVEILNARKGLYDGIAKAANI